MSESRRLDELDVLRGFAVAIMILVVSPGSWMHTYAQLQHATWHGWTFADLVFPDFLFGVGMALGLTFGRSLNPHGDRRAFWTKVGRRVIGLIVLGLALNYLAVVAGWLGAPSVGPSDEVTWRIPGVLQRIAVVYLIAVFVLMATSSPVGGSTLSPRPVTISWAIAAILVGYWALLTYVPVPGYGAGQLDMAGNLAAYIDRAVFGTEHMWPLGSESWRGPVVYDPEGILSSLPASANVLFGVIAATIWTSGSRWRIPALLLGGIVLLAVGLMLDPYFPINKKIWTSSFVLVTSGISFLALMLVAALLRAGLQVPLSPFKILGGNAILAFAISITLSALASIPLFLGGEPTTLQQIGFDLVQRIMPEPFLASFTCALGVLVFILLLIVPLHRRGIHVRL